MSARSPCSWPAERGLGSSAWRDRATTSGCAVATSCRSPTERARPSVSGKPPSGEIDAFIDTFGGGYVELAIELGVAPERINTIIDFEAAQRYGVNQQGTHAVATAERLAELARLAADGSLEIPIAATFPLAEVRAAFRELEERHSRGKIVLLP